MEDNHFSKHFKIIGIILKLIMYKYEAMGLEYNSNSFGIILVI